MSHIGFLQLLTIFRNWLEIIPSRYDIGILEKMTITKTAFNAMQSSEHNEKASQVLRQIIYLIDLERHAELNNMISQYIVQYFNECDAVIKQGLDEDTEGYVEVFVAYGLKCINFLVYQPGNNSMDFLKYLVSLTPRISLPSLEALAAFWRKFSKILLEACKNGKVSEETFSAFKGILMDLVRMMAKSCNLTQSLLMYAFSETKIPNDDLEDWEMNDKARRCVRATFDIIIQVASDQACIEAAATFIKEDADKLQINNQDIQSWIALESDLFAMSCFISESKPPTHNITILMSWHNSRDSGQRLCEGRCSFLDTNQITIPSYHFNYFFDP